MADRGGALQRLRGRQEALESAIEKLPPQVVTSDCLARLLKIVRAERRFLERMESNKLMASPPRLSSSNLGHLEAVVQILGHPLVTGASGVMQSFSTHAAAQSEALAKGRKITAYVDVVCAFDGKPVWIITAVGNPKYIFWLGEGAKKGLRARLFALLITACEDVVTQPAYIFLCFAGKLVEMVDHNLQVEFGAMRVETGFQDGTDDQDFQEPPPKDEEDEDEDWIQIITREEDTETSGTGSIKNAVYESICVGSDVVAKQSNVLPEPCTSGFWTTYVLKVSRVRLAQLLSSEDVAGRRPWEIGGETMKLGEHIFMDGYTGQGGVSRHEDIRPALFWSEERDIHQRMGNPGTLVSLAQSLSEALVSMEHLGRQPSANHMDGCKLVNLDTTALVAWVSQLSNGGAISFLQMDSADLRSRFGNMWKFIREQAKSELDRPLVPEMEAVFSGRIPAVAQFALKEFKSIVAVVGGPQEKQRARDLLNRLHVLPNMPSVRVMALEETGRIKERHKFIFGTADFWSAPTLTANISFVRAARNTGMVLAAIEHRPRALTGD